MRAVVGRAAPPDTLTTRTARHRRGVIPDARSAAVEPGTLGISITDVATRQCSPSRSACGAVARIARDSHQVRIDRAVAIRSARTFPQTRSRLGRWPSNERRGEPRRSPPPRSGAALPMDPPGGCRHTNRVRVTCVPARKACFKRSAMQEPRFGDHRRSALRREARASGTRGARAASRSERLAVSG